MLNTSNYLVRVPAFEGPLDLLLHLIEREELDITRISLAQVTRQYLDYLAQLEEERGSDLAAFLVVAARLVLIKSRALLPRPPSMDEPDEDVGDDLVRQLRLYKQFKEIAGTLSAREELGLRSFPRIAAVARADPHLDLDGVTLDDLVSAAREALCAMPEPDVGELITPASVTIWQQIEVIEDLLSSIRRVRFGEVLSKAASRVEIIVTLLAVLELVKRRRIAVSQDHMFGEIVIEGRDPLDDSPVFPARATAGGEP